MLLLKDFKNKPYFDYFKADRLQKKHPYITSAMQPVNHVLKKAPSPD